MFILLIHRHSFDPDPTTELIWPIMESQWFGNNIDQNRRILIFCDDDDNREPLPNGSRILHPHTNLTSDGKFSHLKSQFEDVLQKAEFYVHPITIEKKISIYHIPKWLGCQIPVSFVHVLPIPFY